MFLTRPKVTLRPIRSCMAGLVSRQTGRFAQPSARRGALAACIRSLLTLDICPSNGKFCTSIPKTLYAKRPGYTCGFCGVEVKERE